MGQRCSNTTSVSFDDVVVSNDNVVGGVGKGFLLAMKTFDASRPVVASNAVGISQRVLDIARLHPESMCLTSDELADLAAQVEAARLLVRKSALAAEQNDSSGSVVASMAKLMAGNMAQRYTALSSTANCDTETKLLLDKLYRDAKIFAIYEGTSEIQKLIIARRILHSNVS